MGDETFDYDSDNSLALSQNSGILGDMSNGNLNNKRNSSCSFNKLNSNLSLDIHALTNGFSKNGHSKKDGDEHEINGNNNENGHPVSFMHKQHCPQTEKNGGLGDNILLESQSTIEQVKALCEFRERQVQRGEETISALQKDKRALNHHIGLMKSELFQLKTNSEELEKLLCKI